MIRRLKSEIPLVFRDAFERGDMKRALLYLSDSYVDHSPLDAPVSGVQGFMMRAQAIRGAFADIALQVGHVVAERDLIAFQWTLTGHHAGAFAGLAPTGRHLRMEGSNMERLEAGKIVEHWSYPDLAGLMRQLRG